MTATATYTSATKQLAVTGDGLPDPVSYGTFPNLNNPNAATERYLYIRLDIVVVSLVLRGHLMITHTSKVDLLSL